MPATLLDTIRVTRLLGVRFLWIDSLCIVQDSEEDKKKEIEKIKDIFENSIVTIVAAGADSATAGFLFDRDLTPRKRLISMPFGSPDGIPLAFLADLYYVDPNQDDPVHKRAWTLEEWLLLRRRLCYTGNQLVWQCLGFEDCDGGNLELSVPGFEGLAKPSRIQAHKKWQEWARIISIYTSREMTYLRDRLKAIDGIAQKMREQFHIHYLYGLWQEDLLSGLCWRRFRWMDLVERPRGLDIPSWTWASVGFEVEWDSPSRLFSNSDRLSHQNISSVGENVSDIEAYAWFHSGLDVDAMKSWRWRDVEAFNTRKMDNCVEGPACRLILNRSGPDRELVIEGPVALVEQLEIPSLETCLFNSAAGDFSSVWAPLCNLQLCDCPPLKEFASVLWPDTVEAWSAEPKDLRCLFLDFHDLSPEKRITGKRNFDSCGLLLLHHATAESQSRFRRIGWFRCPKQDLNAMGRQSIILV